MSTPPPGQSRRSGDGKKPTPPSTIVTRNGARKAKIQTRAMSAGAKPSESLLAAKKKAQQQKKKQSGDTVLRDHYQIAMDSKAILKGPTGFVTEPRMTEHRCLWDDNYPECPERLISIIDRCTELDLISQCQSFPARAATAAEVSALHSPSVHEMMQTTHRNQDLEYLEELSSKYDAVYIHPSTHELALLSAGSTIDMVSRVVSREIQNGCAFIRPPGHHAMKAEPCGYCIYNNVALAANHATKHLGINRILIVDWDVHHGQATQQMFYDDHRVLYFSVHRYEHGAFWPNLRQSNFNYVGCGRGRGYNVNVPLNKTGMKDADYLAIWHQLLLPIALEYQPELIIVSAGYDAAVGCPEGEMQVTPACYATLTHLLQSVCPSLCVVLEGGYCLPSLAEGAALTLRTLLGHAPPRLTVGEPSDEIRDTILNCIYALKPHWSCFNHQPTYSLDGVPNVCDGEKQKHTVCVRWEGDETRPERFATRDCYPVQSEQTKRDIAAKLNHLRLVTDLSVPKHAVCYVYDQAMLKHHNVCEPGHVECPERILRIHERLRDYGLLARMREVRARAASDDEILSVHTEKHLTRLKELSKTKLRDLNSQKEAFDSVYFHPDSLESAAVAAGSVIEAVDAVLSGACGAAACVVRPPGHHADEELPSGFCLLNNAAIGARHAVQQHGLKRVLLLDWDVHHGNGTQRITYEDNEILYVSLHRYDHGSFFPSSRDADYTAVGAGRGEGYNVNIPWNKRGMGDAEYLSAFSRAVLPLASEYAPELVLVSAGFDACVGDPLGGCRVTPECYGRMTHMLRSLAAGRVVLCLEGGYNVTSISYAMTMCVKALLGDPIQHHYDPKPTVHWSAVESINNVIKTHKKYWKSLKFQLALPIENVLQEPFPSRGIEITEKDENSTCDATRLSEMSLSSTLDDSTKSIDKSSKSITSLDETLESKLADLSIDKNKCSDGIHCGTDDEDEENRKKVNTPGCSKTDSEPTPGSSKDTKEEKKTLVDFLSENMRAIVNEDMFAVIPMPWCPHLAGLAAIPEGVRYEQGVRCVACEHTEENWVCLTCHVTACARGVNAHMQAHYLSSSHPLALSLSDLSVWCSECDAYIDNAALYDAKNNAHRCKFGEDMPWCYGSDTVHMN